MNHQMIVYHRIFLDIEQIFVEKFGLFQPSNFLFNFDSFIILLCCLLLIANPLLPAYRLGFVLVDLDF